jgi:serine/threonine protein kinase
MGDEQPEDGSTDQSHATQAPGAGHAPSTHAFSHYDPGMSSRSRPAHDGGAMTENRVGVVVGGQWLTSLGDYELVESIATGGMGQVFKAQHRMMKRWVALKVLPPEISSSPKALQRFRREVEAAAQLSHPNIVTAYDAREEAGIHFLVMEFVDGEDLANRVRTRGPLPVAEVVDFVIQAARGLEYAHHKGIIHRDIKPSNLIVDANGSVKILDLGLARLSAAALEPDQNDPVGHLTPKQTIIGTAAFMAPEQAEDPTKADARADVYSLGCTFYFLLVGRPPYGGDTMVKRILAHRSDSIPSLREARPTISLELDAVFQQMVAKQPDLRYASMGDVIRSLLSCKQLGLETEPPAMTDPIPPSQTGQPTGAERRIYPRRPANCVVLCRLVDAPDRPQVRGRTVNVSQSGACLTVPMELQKGDVVEIDFVGKQLTVRGVVQWVTMAGSDRCSIGCHYDSTITAAQLFRLTL